MTDAGPDIPESDHVTRYCPPRRLEEDGRPGVAAFALRPNEDYLSVNWLEFHEGTTDARLEAVRQDLERGLTLKRSGKLAVLQVEKTIARVQQNAGRRIRFTHEPIAGDSHSGLRDTNHSPDALRIRQELAQAVVSTHPART